jgi:UDP-N-acetylmuramyl pentapeptide phosphotransferase/UDP-N-acetylglucosamine-1-phosphate transferase
MTQPLWGAATLSFFFTLLFALFLVCTKSLHSRLTNDRNIGVQKVHRRPTPRVGGLATLFGFGSAILFLRELDSDIMSTHILQIFLASLPVFISGLLEDILKKVSISQRFFATVLSALIAIYSTGVVIERVDIFGIDFMLSIYAFSLLLTVIAVTGVTHSINIIDGFNGLASGVVIIVALGLALISYQVGDIGLTKLGILISLSALGFMFLNYPVGKIFLGDGGAYFYGFLLSWFAILLPLRNPEVSPWASLLVCGYPITETLFSVYRRAKLQLHIGYPDKEHLHSLLYRLIASYLPGRSIEYTNAFIAPPLWAIALLPIPLVVLFFDNSAVLSVGFVLFFLVYGILYSLVKTSCEKLYVLVVPKPDGRDGD